MCQKCSNIVGIWNCFYVATILHKRKVSNPWKSFSRPFFRTISGSTDHILWKNGASKGEYSEDERREKSFRSEEKRRWRGDSNSIPTMILLQCSCEHCSKHSVRKYSTCIEYQKRRFCRYWICIFSVIIINFLAWIWSIQTVES